MHLEYVLFIYGLEIQIFNLFWTHMQLHHITHHISKKYKSITSKTTFHHKKFVFF
jgi:hypothetical protein